MFCIVEPLGVEQTKAGTCPSPDISHPGMANLLGAKLFTKSVGDGSILNSWQRPHTLSCPKLALLITYCACATDAARAEKRKGLITSGKRESMYKNGRQKLHASTAMRVQGVVNGQEPCYVPREVPRGYGPLVVNRLESSSVLSGACRACALFVLEDTFHNTGGAQPSDNDHDTIPDFLRDGQGRGGQIERVVDVQRMESNGMANSHVGPIHLPARVRRVEEETDHHHSARYPR